MREARIAHHGIELSAVSKVVDVSGLYKMWKQVLLRWVHENLFQEILSVPDDENIVKVTHGTSKHSNPLHFPLEPLLLLSILLTSFQEAVSDIFKMLLLSKLVIRYGKEI